MTGNIWITIKTFFQQHLFCMHKYKWVYRRDNGADFQACEKCGLIK